MITVPHARFFSSLQTLWGRSLSSEDKCRNPRGSLSDEIIAGKHNKKKQDNVFKPSDFTVQPIFLSLWLLRTNSALQDAINKCVNKEWTLSHTNQDLQGV